MTSSFFSDIYAFQADVDMKQPKEFEIIPAENNLVSKECESNASLCSASQLNDEIDDNCSNSPLYIAFKPLIVSLKLFGLHHCRRRKKENESVCGLPTASQLYSWVVTVVAWLLVIRSVATMRLVGDFGPVMLSNISFLAWLILCASNSTSFLLACHFPCNERKFFRGYAKLNRFGGAFIRPSDIKKYVTCFTIAAWVVVCINYLFVCYLLYSTGYFDMMTVGVFSEDTTAYVALKIVYCFLMLYLEVLWIFPSAMQLSLSVTLYKEFSCFSESFRAKMSTNKSYLGNLEVDRRRFLKMLRMVEAADDSMSLHQSSSLVCNSVKICLLLYNVIYYPSVPQNPAVVIVSAFWLCLDVSDISVVIISGVLITSSVSSVYASLVLIFNHY